MLLSEYQAQVTALLGRYAKADLIITSELSVDARTPKMGVIKGALGFVEGVSCSFLPSMSILDSVWKS